EAERVEALAPIDLVLARIEIYQVVAGAGQDRVLALPGPDHVVSGEAEDLVLSCRARQFVILLRSPNPAHFASCWSYECMRQSATNAGGRNLFQAFRSFLQPQARFTPACGFRASVGRSRCGGESRRRRA